MNFLITDLLEFSKLRKINLKKKQYDFADYK